MSAELAYDDVNSEKLQWNMTSMFMNLRQRVPQYCCMAAVVYQLTILAINVSDMNLQLCHAAEETIPRYHCHTFLCQFKKCPRLRTTRPPNSFVQPHKPKTTLVEQPWKLG